MGDLIQLFPTTPHEKPSDPFWITLAKRSTECESCGNAIECNREMVYRHYPQSILCKGCADESGIDYLPSRRWKEREEDYWGAA